MNKKIPKLFFFLFLAIILPLVAFSETAVSSFDNLLFGIPGKADTIIDRPGYALGYIEYHEQPA